MTAVPAMSTTLSGATAMPGSFTVAALIDPEGRVVDTPAAWREARAFTFHWAQP